jgi:Carboxypeptidase regulatory-like domain
MGGVAVRLLLSALLVSVVLLAGCSSKPSITGKVLDNFGSPLADARVTIKNSAFSTTTGSDGSYSIDFMPGSFTISITKPGYTEADTPLNIASTGIYPMSEVSLIKIPPAGNFFLQGAKDWIPLGYTGVNVATRSTGFMSNSSVYSLAPGQDKDYPFLNGSQVVVADLTPDKYGLVHIKNGNTIGTVTNGGPISVSSDVQHIDDTPQRYTNFVLRTVTLSNDPNNMYCYVRFELSTAYVGIAPVPDSYAYCFHGPK